MNDDQEPVILHLGDHDPSGIDMSRDIEDRLRMFMQNDGLESCLEFQRLALHMSQIEELHPPPNPAKVTDSRFEDYRRRFGEESWELDALEPRVIERLVEQKIRSFVDRTQLGLTTNEELRHKNVLKWAAENWSQVEKIWKKNG